MPPLINCVAMLGTAGLIYTLLCVGSPVISRAAQNTGSKPTIAAVTAGVDDLDKVRSLYGNGAETSVQDIRGLCYYVEQDRAYLSVSSFEHENRVRSVTLTTFADIAPRCRAATITGKHLTALHGIGLGDSMAKVQSALGAPSGGGKMQMANHELVYADYSVAGGQLTCQYEREHLVLIAVEASSGQLPNQEQATIVAFAKKQLYRPSTSGKAMPPILPAVGRISPTLDGETS